MARLGGGGFHACAASEHDQVGQRDPLAATGLRAVEVLLDRLERAQHLREFGRLVGPPVLLRREPDARAVGAAAHVGAAEGGSRSPRGLHELLRREARVEQRLLQRRDVGVVDQRVVHGGDRVLPQQVFLGHQCAEIADLGPHVAVRELEPGTGEGVGKVLRVGEEAARDLLVGRVGAQAEVGGRHHRLVQLAGDVRIGHVAPGVALGLPLVRAGGALRQFPLEAEQRLQIAHVPLRRRRGPCAFEAAGGCVRAYAGLEGVLPAQAQLLDVRAFGRRAHLLGVARAVALAEGVAAGDEGHGLFVVHRHAREGVADVARRARRVGLAVGSFRVHVDQAHLHGGQRACELAFAAVAFGAEPGGLGAPVDRLRFPDVLAAAAEAEGLEAHGVQRYVAGQDRRGRPREARPLFCLIGHVAAQYLVEVAVVGPAVQWCRRPLLAGARAAGRRSAIGAGRVPGHADEERAVVAAISRPPVLRVGHQRVRVGDDGVQVELAEFLRIVEVLDHRVGQFGMLVQHAQVQLVGPPIRIGARLPGRVRDGALGYIVHGAVGLLRVARRRDAPAWGRRLDRRGPSRMGLSQPGHLSAGWDGSRSRER